MFISANAFDFEHGLSNLDFESVDSKVAFLNHTDRCVVMVDSSKIGKHAGRMFLPTSKIDVVVTDNGVTEDQITQFQQQGITLIVAR